MKIDKQFTVEAPQQVVWDFITSADKVAPCIPGCQDVEAIAPDKYRAAIKLQAGPIKTTFHVTVTTTEARPPEYSAYLTEGEEGGKASRLKATSALSVTSIDSLRTQVGYTSEIMVTGRLGKFGIGVMKKIADKLNEQFITELRARIEQGPD